MSLVLLAVVTVGREGLETALILWSNTQTLDSSTNPLIGALLGILAAVVIAVLLYRGALTLDLRKFFTWTGAFLVVVAAGILAYAVHDLQEADVLPGLGNLVWDVSAQIPPDSWYGTLLKGTVNFSPQTTWLELAAWWLYIVPTMFFFIRTVRRPLPPKPVDEPTPVSSLAQSPGGT
jgi:high-affinity iron transporter